MASALAMVLLGTSPGAAWAGLVFNFTPASGMDPQAIAGFAAAGARWSALFSDNITVNININFTNLPAGVLGSTGSTQANYTYANVRNALIADKTSADDNTSTAALQAGPAFNMLLNRTSNNPNGSGSATPYLDNDGDANNTTINMSNANAKALGLLAANNAAVDASISFSNLFTWDFDPSNGINAGAFDFVGIATHEIGHALGFISGVDILDINSPPVRGPFRDDQFTFVSTADLFRFSAASVQQGVGVIDWTADTRNKYFSVDGGTTAGALFSNGVNFGGDGRQASHWRDNLGLGIMDPTAAPGELLAISNNDIRLFDVIGYNLGATPAVPEPGSLALLAIGACGLAGYARRRKANAAAEQAA
ncbi:MAG: NF038122 family metalloprotease [Gemmataceae bacterium]